MQRSDQRRHVVVKVDQPRRGMQAESHARPTLWRHLRDILDCNAGSVCRVKRETEFPFKSGHLGEDLPAPARESLHERIKITAIPPQIAKARGICIYVGVRDTLERRFSGKRAHARIVVSKGLDNSRLVRVAIDCQPPPGRDLRGARNLALYMDEA